MVKSIPEIIKKHGSLFYKVDVEKITFFQKTKSETTHIASVNECLLLNIHPKDLFENKEIPLLIKIDYRMENTSPNFDLTKSEDIQQFDKLWKTLLDEVSQDENIAKLRTMGLEIHVENLRLRQKLIERINIRHKL